MKNKLLTFLGIMFMLSANVTGQEAPWRFSRVESPQIHADRSVTFNLFAPAASEILLNGGWMGWGENVALVKNDTGLWSVTAGPLEPEIYTYAFYVDGVKVLDPANTSVVRDGRRFESMLLIPGERSALYMVRDVPHGTLSKVWYESPTLEMNRRMYVYTPPGYAESGDRYPVLYLLHGGGGDEDAWTTLGRTCQIMDNLIAEKRCRPMIVVMTNGNPGDAAAPGEEPVLEEARQRGGIFEMGTRRFEESLVKDVIPFVEKHYRTLAGSENRAVSGLSMGGMQTMNLGFDHPEMFSYYGVMSMGITGKDRSGRNWFQDVEARMQHLKEYGYQLYWVGCGTDDFLHDAAVNLVEEMKRHDMEVVYLETGGGHTWSNWRIYLSELAPLLFR
ncbi:MAG TPA: glycosyl hydrolase [Bacteroides sp.]|nr:glycosyl hydrolase [Bacteroides sp.]